MKLHGCVLSWGGVGGGNAYWIWVGIAEGKRSPDLRNSRWEDNIKMILKEIGWEVVDWTDLVQDKD
jgi:hypothetical protein